METAYKLRAIPLALGVLTLAVGGVLRLAAPALDSPVWRYGAWMTVIGFVFFQAMRQLKRERQTKAQSVEEQEQTEAAALAGAPEVAEAAADEAYRRKNAVPFLAVRAALSGILGLLGVSLMVDGRWLWGAALCLFGCGLCWLHIVWIRQHVKALKEGDRQDDLEKCRRK